MQKKQGIIGIFSYPDIFIDTVIELKKIFSGKIKLYSPFPLHELEDIIDKKPSKVRYFTFFGAVIGFVTAWLLTLYSSFEWNLITGGKPIASIPPYIVVAFEFTVLFGGVATFIGLIITAGLPKISLSKEYDKRFTVDKFGIYLECSEEEVNNIVKLLESQGAEEVKVAE